MARHRRGDDALDQIGIGEPAKRSRAADAGTVGQIAVGVDVDDVGRAVGGEAQIDACVVGQLEREEGGARGGGAARGQLVGDVGAHRARALVLLRRGIPLALVGDDARRAGGHPGEVDLVHGQRVERLAVAHERDVELAAVDELLDEDRLAVARVHLGDARGELPLRLDDRAQRDARRGVLARGLDDAR